jgi:hypothetical protein
MADIINFVVTTIWIVCLQYTTLVPVLASELSGECFCFTILSQDFKIYVTFALGKIFFASENLKMKNEIGNLSYQMEIVKLQFEICI